jgi:hypothetical protein
MNGNNGKPKLELLVNQPTRIKLLQDKPATGESNFGPWWLFNVEADGQEQSFFAPKEVVDFIKQNSLGKNAVISITKTLVKNGKKTTPEYKIEVVASQAAQNVEGPTAPTNGNGKSDDSIRIMRECLIAGIDLQKELGSVVDVNKVALSLYISKTKNGNGYQF